MHARIPRANVVLTSAVLSFLVQGMSLAVPPSATPAPQGDSPQGGIFVNTGADDCPSVTVVPVAVGPTGFPNSVTILGDSSTASGSDCQHPADVGWWEAFEITDYANVTIDFCGTTPNRRPDWGALYGACGCFGGHPISFSDRTTCGDVNVTLYYFGVPPGIYYHPLYTIPGNFVCGDTNNPCVTSADCIFPDACSNNLHAYTMHISAEVALGGCCHPNLPSCTENVPHSGCTNPDDRWVAGALCSEINCIPFTSGPDLIVGDVRLCEQLGREGTPGSGTIGMSCWTTACTIGDQGTDWYGLPDVNHPMISVNLFRLRNEGGAERLMQLGQSWLKHGFASENHNDCGFGCTPGHANLNGPGCSDTYSAVQFWPCDLGPRSMINPFTGVMPSSGDLGASDDCIPQGREAQSYLANDHRGHDHNSISHKLQVKDADLNPSSNIGATYFSEGQYLVPHEGVFGNGIQNNNVSHRQVGVSCVGPCSSGNYAFTDMNTTFSESPAINAWPGAGQQVIEPDPLVDGRGFLVNTITNLGPVWRYEYALYNMNLDQAMSSFSVPIPPGVTVSNVGFYAPLNHAPEPNTVNYSNTPWAVVLPGSAITWHTETFGANPNANAVRFGTMYNFWFDADTSPDFVFAEVGLFKTGGLRLVGTTAPSAVPPPPPPNIIWDPNPFSPLHASRTVTISAQAATAVAPLGTSAIQIEMVDLQHPIPHNRPANPTPNFTSFDTTLNGVCSTAPMVPNYAGHHCDTDADCEGPNTLSPLDDGTCQGQVACGVTDGCVRWVGPVVSFREKQGVTGLGTYNAARLQCTPYYAAWTAIGPFSIFGAEMIPSSTYRARSFASECDGSEPSCTNVSPPVTMTTRRSGDVASPWNPPDSGDQPTGGDVGEVLNKFKGSPGSPSNIAALIFGNVPDPNTDVGGQEIGETVNAFKGLAYSFSGPCACPSAVTCGATACSSTNTAPCGAGLCVLTCVGGENEGLPCRDFPPNTPADHCPGGTCPTDGFCRDRCGRCN